MVLPIVQVVQDYTFPIWHHNLAVGMVLSIVQVVQDYLTNCEENQKGKANDQHQLDQFKSFCLLRKDPN